MRGWIALILPLLLLYAGLNYFVAAFLPVGLVTMALAVVAALIAMGLIFATLFLDATIFRWAVGEPIPAARPFATEPADAATIEEARVRLAMLLRSQRTGQES